MIDQCKEYPTGRRKPKVVRNELILVRHSDEPADDRVFTYARMNGLIPIEKFPFRGDILGDPTEKIIGTVVYGGRFNVFDENKYPFLLEENRWISACMEANLPVLGICQGAQQIARILGAKVGPLSDNRHEFGYYEVTPTAEAGAFLSEPMHFTQAHFHTFELPKGAVHLARSKAFENQAYRYGKNVYGFQFHPECTVEGFRRWQKNFSSEEHLGIQTREEQDALMMTHDAAQATWFYNFMSKLFGSV